MHAMVFHGPGNTSWERIPDPAILQGTDAIVRVDAGARPIAPRRPNRRAEGRWQLIVSAATDPVVSQQ